jgi:hypothetical protein
MQNAANNLTSQQSNQASALQAALANQSTNLAAQQSNQSSSLEAALADATASNAASMRDAELGLMGEQQSLAGNQQLMDVLGAGRDATFQNLDTRLGAGDMLDTREQDQLDLAYQKWIDEQNHELNQANILQGAASGYPTGSTTTGGGKIVCTMMNDLYGFGEFRNKIWLAHSVKMDPSYQRGYHKLFLPLVAFAKGEGRSNLFVRKTLEHIMRHRTADIWKQKRGKRDRIGQAYRLVFEPICYVVGKVVK